MNRRTFIKKSGLFLTSSLSLGSSFSSAKSTKKPNIILVMSDDQGWGDVGYQAHPILKTPHLDDMAASGIRFDRFYSGGPFCMPTRNSCLVGRHPMRYKYQIKPEEVTIAEALKDEGYTTAHFGKWHLGHINQHYLEPEHRLYGIPMTRSPEREHYKNLCFKYLSERVTPWENGFDECFTSETNVSTWDPLDEPPYWKNVMDTYPWSREFWTGDGKSVKEGIKGCTDGVLVDKALQFIQRAKNNDTPFLCVIWFYTPHRPVVAGEKYRNMYKDLPEGQQHYYGALTAMDEQVGKLRSELRKKRLAEDTMLWFCSDNGPSKNGSKSHPHSFGSTKGLRGGKGNIYEGGIRVPGILEWPGKIQGGQISNYPCVTSDFLPTILNVVGGDISKVPQPLDGVNLMDAIQRKTKIREKPICFEGTPAHWYSLIDNNYKLIEVGDSNFMFKEEPREPKIYELYNLEEDPSETTNLVEKNPDVFEELRDKLDEWKESCRRSAQGCDYK